MPALPSFDLRQPGGPGHATACPARARARSNSLFRAPGAGLLPALCSVAPTAVAGRAAFSADRGRCARPVACFHRCQPVLVLAYSPTFCLNRAFCSFHHLLPHPDGFALDPPLAARYPDRADPQEWWICCSQNFKDEGYQFNSGLKKRIPPTTDFPPTFRFSSAGRPRFGSGPRLPFRNSANLPALFFARAGIILGQFNIKAAKFIPIIFQGSSKSIEKHQLQKLQFFSS